MYRKSEKVIKAYKLTRSFQGISMRPMLLSFYIHISLLIALGIFSYSLASFVLRIQQTKVLTSSPQSLSSVTLSDSQRRLSNLSNETNETFTSDSDTYNNEKILLERVFGQKKIRNSILNRFKYINPPNLTNMCPNSSEIYMIFVVLSRAINFDYRHTIRATWGRSTKYRGFNINLKTIFFVGTDDSTQSAVRIEQSNFNDVVEIVVPESYALIAHKELASLLWIRLYCPSVPLLFRADDDILLDTFLLLNYIHSNINSNIIDGIHGWFRVNNTVHRGGRWAITKAEYSSNIYPPYTFGVGYLFSNNSCQLLIDAANHEDHQIVRIGDAYITGILREKAQIPYFDFFGLEFAYSFYSALRCDELFIDNSRLLLCMSKLHVGQRDDLFEFYDVWNIILSKHNRTLLNSFY